MSGFTPKAGGQFTVTLGAVADDVTHITALPMRSELLSVTGDGTNLAFSVIGDGHVVIDLKNPGSQQVSVTGAEIVSLSGEAAFTQDVVALPSGEMWAFQGSVPTRAVANVFPGRSLGPDACEAQGTSGGIYVTSNKSGYCGGTGPTCSPRAGSTFGVTMAFRRTRLADGATLYWMARSISEAAPSDPSAVPFWNYGACGGMPSGTTSTNRRCRLYRVERP